MAGKSSVKKPRVSTGSRTLSEDKWKAEPDLVFTRLSWATQISPSAPSKSVSASQETNQMDRDFPGGPAAKPLCSQCRGSRFNPWSGNQIPHATIKDQRSHMLQLRPSAVK